MAKNTCGSTTIYVNSQDRYMEPFRTQRSEKALAMFNEGKCESYPNHAQPIDQENFQVRYWVDQAAAQEYIDYVMSLAASYNMQVYSSIRDFDISDTTVTLPIDVPDGYVTWHSLDEMI